MDVSPEALGELKLVRRAAGRAPTRRRDRAGSRRPTRAAGRRARARPARFFRTRAPRDPRLACARATALTPPLLRDPTALTPSPSHHHPQALTSSLERKGVLAKVKAQLRAHVFEAVRDQGGVAPPGAHRPFRDGVPRGDLLASLVHEYLEWAGLDYSRRVFAAESGEPEDETSAARRGRLADAFGVAGDATDDVPILAALLARTTNRAPAGVFEVAEGLRTEPEPGPEPADPAPPSPPVIARASAAPARPSSAPRGRARGRGGATFSTTGGGRLPRVPRVLRLLPPCLLSGSGLGRPFPPPRT